MSRLIRRVPLDYVHDGVTTDPPSGDGWQVWEDVSEGSPVSPVFSEHGNVVLWLVEHEKCSPAAAEAFVKCGWAPSFIGTGFGLFTGVQAAAGPAAHIEWLHVQAGDNSTLPPGTPVRHKESGVDGRLISRMAPPNGEYYVVEWSRGLPSLLDGPVDPAEPMTAGCHRSGFDVAGAIA